MACKTTPIFDRFNDVHRSFPGVDHAGNWLDTDIFPRRFSRKWMQFCDVLMRQRHRTNPVSFPGASFCQIILAGENLAVRGWSTCQFQACTIKSPSWKFDISPGRSLFIFKNARECAFLKIHCQFSHRSTKQYNRILNLSLCNKSQKYRNFYFFNIIKNIVIRCRR